LEIAAAAKRIGKPDWAELVQAGLFPDAADMTEGL
jgi:hypothetical protein